MDELISIVIPIYNVEKYLKNCVDSVCNQTYQNLEIILVDDGSPDHCPEICEEYARNDPRVRVIHKQNGGLSDARNKGIDIATGAYIMFVDSDDYMPTYAVEYLYELLTKYQADASIGKLEMTKDLNSKGNIKSGTNRLFNNKEAIGQLLYANLFSTSASAKLYKMRLFKEIRFPVGKLHEDLYTIYKVFDKAQKIVYGSNIVYFYYHRTGSITVSKFSVKRLDAIDALNQLKADINISEYNIQNAFSSQILENIYSYFFTDITCDEIVKYGLWTMVKENRKNVLFDKCVSKRIKGYAVLSYAGLQCALLITRCYYKRKWK